MNDAFTLLPTRHKTTRPGVPVAAADMPRLATLRNMVATWSWRSRFRRDLAQKSRDEPHLIDDIGLTRRQVEAEIAKHFWQA